MTHILFVCLGNICRSPLAEGIAKAIATHDHLPCHIDSAGTSHFHVGEAPCADSIKVAKMHQIDISTLRAREVTPQDATTFDHIIAMDHQNKKTLQAMGFERVSLLGEYGGYEGKDVPDPYYFNSFDEGIESVYEMIASCVEDLMAQICQEPTQGEGDV